MLRLAGGQPHADGCTGDADHERQPGRGCILLDRSTLGNDIDEMRAPSRGSRRYSGQRQPVPPKHRRVGPHADEQAGRHQRAKGAKENGKDAKPGITAGQDGIEEGHEGVVALHRSRWGTPRFDGRPEHWLIALPPNDADGAACLCSKTLARATDRPQRNGEGIKDQPSLGGTSWKGHRDQAF